MRLSSDDGGEKLKYNFKPGDYVETLDGRIGYIHKIEITHDSFREKYFMTIRFKDEELMRIEFTEGGIYLCDYYLFENYFVRIGEYQFIDITKETNLLYVEEVLNRFGIIVRDEVGGFKPVNEVMRNIAYLLKEMRETTSKREYEITSSLTI